MFTAACCQAVGTSSPGRGVPPPSGKLPPSGDTPSLTFCVTMDTSILIIKCHFPNRVYDSFTGEVHRALPVLSHV